MKQIQARDVNIIIYLLFEIEELVEVKHLDRRRIVPKERKIYRTLARITSDEKEQELILDVIDRTTTTTNDYTLNPMLEKNLRALGYEIVDTEKENKK